MAIREVIRMGHPTLRLKAAPVTTEELHSDELKALIQDMFDTMDEEEGIGIAAPQINISKQVAIVGIPHDNPRHPDVDIDEDDGPGFDTIVVINPKLTVIDEEISGNYEACLSVPGMRGYVERPSGVKVDYLDQQGREQTIELSGFGAIVMQHELDHLEGKLYVDRIKDITTLAFNDAYEEEEDFDSGPDKD